MLSLPPPPHPRQKKNYQSDKSCLSALLFVLKLLDYFFKKHLLVTYVRDSNEGFSHLLGKGTKKIENKNINKKQQSVYLYDS